MSDKLKISIPKFFKNYQDKMHCCLSSVQHYVLDNIDDLINNGCIEVEFKKKRNKYYVKDQHRFYLIVKRDIKTQKEHMNEARKLRWRKEK